MSALRNALLCFFVGGIPLADSHPWISRLEDLKSQSRYLELRSELKFQIKKQKLEVDDFKRLRTFVYTTPEMGMDLLYQWDSVESSLAKTPSTAFSKALLQADNLSLTRNFAEAAKEYARVALQVKSDLESLQKSGDRVSWEQARIFYSYVLHDLARALYGAGDYEGSLKVYNWLAPSYPRLRIALLEKMWAAIRSGNSPHALGVWYSIRSPYFSEFVSPEEYLVTIYALQALCMSDEAKRVYELMKKMNFSKFSQEELFKMWVKKDYETLVYWNLVSNSDALQDATEERERKRIYSELKRSFAKDYADIIRSYDKLRAMSFLANLPESQKKLQRLMPRQSRADYFKKGLEVWHNVGGEFWVDEMASYVYMGDSQCR